MKLKILTVSLPSTTRLPRPSSMGLAMTAVSKPVIASGQRSNLMALGRALVTAAFALLTSCGHAESTRPLAETAREAVVKTESAPCDGRGPSLTSSGLLVRHGDSVYVLQSEAFVYHGGQGFCHSLWTAKLGKKTTQLIAADWGTGTALLKVRDLAPDSSMLSLDDFTEIDSEAGEKVTVAGYSYKADELRVEDGGSILLPVSTRHGLALVPRTVEIQGAFADSGMVGGMVWKPEGNLVGMLSHEYLKMTPGSSTRLYEWDGVKAHWERHLVVIRGADLRHWLESYLVKEDGRLSFFRSPKDQMAKVSKVSSGGVAFSVLCPAKVDVDDGEGPIGGADGVGVGGDGSDSPFCKLKVEKAEVADGHWPIPAKQGWFDELQAKVNQGVSLEVLFFVHRKTDSGILARQPLYTSGQLFQRLWNPDLQPATLLPEKAKPADSHFVAVAQKAEAASVAAKRVRDWVTGSLSAALLRETYFLLRVLDTDAWNQVGTKDLDALSDRTGRFQSEWNVAFQTQAASAQAFWTSLRQLRDEVGQR